MKILLVNDDGIDAKGLNSLASVLGEKHDIRVVAPRFEQSAKSHSFTMHEPLEIGELHQNYWWVKGTPADCTYIALHHLNLQPDVIISGINHGTNLGSDIWYSGTVAAAREGALNGIPSIAVSTQTLEKDITFFSKQAYQLLHMLDRLLAFRSMLLNVNISLDQNAPVCLAPLGKRLYRSLAQPHISPRGQSYCWIGGPPEGYEGNEDCDVALYEKGCSTITPLTLDGTHHEELQTLLKK